MGSSPVPLPIKTEEAYASSVFIGAGDRTRTGTPSLAADFESATSTISSHRQVWYSLFPILCTFASRVPVSGCGARNFLFAVRSRNFDRCPSLRSLLPPQAALPSLPRLSPLRHHWRRILSAEVFRESGGIHRHRKAPSTWRSASKPCKSIAKTCIFPNYQDYQILFKHYNFKAI